MYLLRENWKNTIPSVCLAFIDAEKALDKHLVGGLVHAILLIYDNIQAQGGSDQVWLLSRRILFITRETVI